MSNIRKHPTGKVKWAEFYAGTMRLNHMREQNVFLKQHNSQLQGYGRQNPVSGTLSHAYTQTRIVAYIHTHRSKKVIFASIYPNEMATVLAMDIIISRVNIPPPFFFLFQLAKAARSFPTSRCPKPPITPRQHVAWRFVSRRESSRT